MAVPTIHQDELKEDRICAGCGNTVESADLRQLVVSFGNALWHPECFRCAKCSKLVDGGSSLLLLSDGNPLCSDCTFTCGVCHKSIIDEAITTGSDAYHADCFKCRSCKEPIQEVVFAKTRDAVFCMACHNVRIARSRKKQEMRARNKEAGGDSHHRSHRDRSREGHSNRREKAAAPAVPLAPLRTDSSPIPEGESSQADSPLASQSDVTTGAKRLSLIQTIAQGIPPPTPGDVRKPSNRGLHSSPTTGTFVSEAYSKSFQAQGSSPRNSNLSSKNDSLSPTWQQSQHKERHVPGSSPRSSSFPQTPIQGRKEGRRSFNPLDAIIDGMERPYTPRTKNVATNSSNLNSRNDHYEDTSGDGIPDALKEYFQEVVEIEPAPRRPSPVPNGHLSQPRSFFDTPSPSVMASSTNPSVQPTPEPASHRSTPKSIPISVTPVPSEIADHVKDAPSSRRQFDAFDGLEEEDVTQKQQLQEVQPPQKQNILSISPQEWMNSPSRSRPGTANQEVGNTSIFSQFGKMQTLSSSSGTTVQTSSGNNTKLRPSTSPATSPSGEVSLKAFADCYAYKPTTPTSPLTPEGVLRPPPASIPRNVTSEGEGETTETESEIQSPVIKGTDNLALSPTQLPVREYSEDGSLGPAATMAMAADDQTAVGNITVESPIQSGSVTSSSEYQGELPIQAEGSTSLAPLSGNKRKRKQEERAPALPPIRISQFYVESPEGVKGPIEVTQVLDDSMSSDSFLDIEGKEDTGSDVVVEGPEDHYVMVIPTEKPEEEVGGGNKRESGKLENRSPRNSGSSSNGGGTPVIVVGDVHRQSEDYSGTSELSHESSVTMISQTSTPEFTRSKGSSESVETMKLQQNIDQSLSHNSKSIKHTQSKSSLRNGAPPTSANGEEVYSVVLSSLNDLIDNATKHNKQVVKLDLKFVEIIRKTLVGEKSKYEDMIGGLDSSKRESLPITTSRSTSQLEYDRERASRRDAQTEVRRLRVLVQEQAAKLSALAGEQRKRDILEKNSKEISTNLVGLEKEMSKLKVERDMTMAEMAELSTSKSSPTGLDSTSLEATGSRLSKALSVRFDGIKSQYKRQLEPLTEQREGLLREIDELTESRKAILEETAALHARNEELMGLNQEMARNIENAVFQQSCEQLSPTIHHPHPPPSSSKLFSASTSSNMSYVDENSRTLRGRPDTADNTRGGLFKRAKNRDISTPVKGDLSSNSNSPNATVNGFQKAMKFVPHAFTQMALLRVARCDHCNDKMWGTQSRCQACGISIHPRCATHVKMSCPGTQPREDGIGQGTTFGRDLIEQVRIDAGDSARLIPVIVEKCIQTIEINAMDYEGLYRKSGGSGQIKAIEALFEKGNYDSIDLLDSSFTSDISCVTSVLKSYFRELPNPLMTSALHESFIDALQLKDLNAKIDSVISLLRQLPREHYETLKFLMLHLNQVQARKNENRMDSKNLGLVFGPTLMRSADVTREFGDMAGKTHMVELLVDHAPTIFRN